MRFFWVFLSFIVALQASEKVYDTIVLGSGAGGLTAALYLERANSSFIIVEGPLPGGALTQSPSVHNWPGEAAVSGSTLMEKIRHQLLDSGTSFLNEEVYQVDLSKRPFTLLTRSNFDKATTHTLKANTLIIAMGSHPKKLHIPGEDLYWTKGVYSCAVCDGPLYKGKTVAVVGGGDAAVTEALFLSDLAKKVFVLVRGKELKTSETLQKNALLKKENVSFFYETSLQEIQGDGSHITSLKLQGKTSPLSVDALFVAIGSTPNSSLFQNQLELTKEGFILLKDHQATSVKGVYAVGDIADPIFQQAISAAGEGAKAALQAKTYLASLEKSSPQPSVMEVTSLEDYEHLLKSNQLPTLVDFYAPWCGPCRSLSPAYEKLAKTLEGKVQCLKVNVEHLSALANRYQITSIPTLVLFDHKGELLTRKVGLADIQELSTKLTSLHNRSPQEIELFFSNKP